jgi:hypothetical protein
MRVSTVFSSLSGVDGAATQIVRSKVPFLRSAADLTCSQQARYQRLPGTRLATISRRIRAADSLSTHPRAAREAAPGGSPEIAAQRARYSISAESGIQQGRGQGNDRDETLPPATAANHVGHVCARRVLTARSAHGASLRNERDRREDRRAGAARRREPANLGRPALI